ncbi:hypothetical protein IJG11_01970 [Candidatus Saccharibacteria bacterium]|nr:hypothetical protein [Candidatus Saccharibacteria bacterium]
MSQQKQNAKKHAYLLRLNDGSEREFRYDKWSERESAISEYVGEKMVELHHPEKFTTSELMSAPWMVTQSAILTQTEYHSLDEVAERAAQVYRYLTHGGGGYKQDLATTA